MARKVVDQCTNPQCPANLKFGGAPLQAVAPKWNKKTQQLEDKYYGPRPIKHNKKLVDGDYIIVNGVKFNTHDRLNNVLNSIQVDMIYKKMQIENLNRAIDRLEKNNDKLTTIINNFTGAIDNAK